MITWFAQKSTHIQAVQSFSRGTNLFQDDEPWEVSVTGGIFGS